MSLNSEEKAGGSRRGFIERFNGTVQAKFFDLAFRTTLYMTIADLEADLDAWLSHYKTQRPHHGYATWGDDRLIPSSIMRNNHSVSLLTPLYLYRTIL